MPQMLKVVVCDDDASVRRLLTQALGAARGLEIVDEVASVDELVAAVGAAPVDVVLLDVQLVEENGLDGIAALRRAGWTGQVVVMSADDRFHDQALAAGAAAFFHKGSAPLGTLAALLRSIAS